MGQRVIPVAVTAEYIGGDGVTLGAAGSHSNVVIEYDFRSAGPMWEGTTKYVLWTNPQGNSTNRVDLGVDKLVDGYENVYHASPTADAMCVAGWCEMVVVGVTVETTTDEDSGETTSKETLKVKTEPSRFRVLPGSSRFSDNEGIAATVADQLQTEIETVDRRKVNKPVTPYDPNGEEGQYLVSLGDGRTKWEAINEDAIEHILEKHPEWVTDLHDGEVSTKKIADEAVTSIKLASGAVTNSRIKDKAVTKEKLADQAVVGRTIASGAVVTTHIGDGTVTMGKLGDDVAALHTTLNNRVSQIEQSMSSSMKFKGAKTYAELANVSSPAQNDTYYVTDRGYNMTWTGSAWVQSSSVLTAQMVQTDDIGNVWLSPTEKDKWMETWRGCPSCTLALNDQTNVNYGESLTPNNSGISNANHPIPYEESLYVKFCRPDTTSSSMFYFGHIQNGTFVPVKRHLLSVESPRWINLEFHAIADQLKADGLYVVLGDTTADQNLTLGDCFEVKRTNPYCDLDFFRTLAIYNIEDSVRNYRHGSDSRTVVYYCNEDTVDPDTGEVTAYGRTRIVWPGAEWLYAGGQCMDVIFYDWNKNPLPGGPVGDMGAPQLLDYPVAVKIPPNARYYKLAVYGLRANNTFYNLAITLPKTISKTGVYCRNIRTLTRAYRSGIAVRNARHLSMLRYEAPIIRMVKYDLVSPRMVGSTKAAKTIVGIPYSGKRCLGYAISWYTFLSQLKAGVGISLGVWTKSNYTFGVSCVGFLSNVLALDHNQGVEWFLQTYADKLERVYPETEFEPGDILVKTQYRFARVVFDDSVVDAYEAETEHEDLMYQGIVYKKIPGGDIDGDPETADPVYPIDTTDPAYDVKDFDQYRRGFARTNISPKKYKLYEYTKDFSVHFEPTADETIDESKAYYAVTSPNHWDLITHIEIIAEKGADPETGDFNGYTFIDEANTWSRQRTTRNLAEAFHWRLPYNVYTANQFRDYYIFDADKETDPLHNAESLVFPPITSLCGDRCIIGPVTEAADPAPDPDHKCKWYPFSAGLYSSIPLKMWMEHGYDKITVYKDGTAIATDLDVTGLRDYDANYTTDNMQSFDLGLDPEHRINPTTNQPYFCLTEPGEYEIYCGKEGESASDADPYTEDTSRCGRYLWPTCPVVKWADDYKAVTLTGSMEDWDALWFRVLPAKPAVVDGYPNGTPWTNYIWVKADEMEITEDGDTRTYSCGDKFRRISYVETRNNGYGSLLCFVCGDYRVTEDMLGDIDDEDKEGDSE